MRSSLRALVGLAPLLLAACQDSVTTIAADDDPDVAGTTGGEDTMLPPEGSYTTAEPPDSTGEVEPEFVPYPARGIRLTEVYANQGVAVPVVGPGGRWVDGSGRNAELIQGRNTMIRGFWKLAADFEPREIEAVLTLSYPDGTQEVARRTMFVETNSKPTDVETNVRFLVPAELIVPQVQFQIELFETAPGYEALPEPEVTKYPTEPGFLGIEGSDMRLKVVIVPVQHDLGDDCPLAPEITEEEAQALADALYQQNPVQHVDLSVRETFTYTNGLGGFGGLLGALAELRAIDSAPDDAYYYGVVRPCDGGPDGVGGQAISIPGFPSRDNDWTRTAVGRWYGSLSSTANTFVHEIGHTQGRRHVYCSGEEGGSDATYPYEGGDIGVWGFGPLDFSLHSPTNAKDYMTYCGNTWVSDWGWRAVVPFIKEITTWSLADAAPPSPADARLLVGLFDEHSAEQTWFVTRGSTAGRAPNPADVFEIDDGDGHTRWVPSSLAAMGEGGYNVAVELPADLPLDAATSIVRWRGTEAHPLTAISVRGRSLALRP